MEGVICNSTPADYMHIPSSACRISKEFPDAKVSAERSHKVIEP